MYRRARHRGPVLPLGPLAMWQVSIKAGLLWCYVECLLMVHFGATEKVLLTMLLTLSFIER